MPLGTEQSASAPAVSAAALLLSTARCARLALIHGESAVIQRFIGGLLGVVMLFMELSIINWVAPKHVRRENHLVRCMLGTIQYPT